MEGKKKPRVSFPESALLPGCAGEKTHIALIGCKAMVNAGGQDEQVILVDANAHPLVVLAAHVKVVMVIVLFVCKLGKARGDVNKSVA